MYADTWLENRLVLLKIKRVNMKHVPLTGCVMARLPHYRLPRGLRGFLGCNCELCLKAREEAEQRVTIDAVVAARSRYIDAFCQELREVCALSGHLHEHKNTCFKYAPEGSRRKPQHCRFNFTHFIKLLQNKLKEDGSFIKSLKLSWRAPEKNRCFLHGHKKVVV